jgi:hypothetical protein
MFQHGVLRVLRTRGIKPTCRPEKGRDEPLVEHERDDDDSASDHRSGVKRRNTRSRSDASRSYSAVAAGGFATTSIRIGASGPASVSRAPRTRRFTRFLRTAPPTLLETEMQIREDPLAVGSAYPTSVDVPTERPRLRTNAISPDRRSDVNQRIDFALELDGQAFPALFATCGENATPILRAHALHETMDALATAVVGLESAFHVLLCSRIGRDGRPPALDLRVYLRTVLSVNRHRTSF